MRSFAIPENQDAWLNYQRQKTELKRDAIIDSWNISTKQKNDLKCILPYDTLEAYEIVDGKPDWIKVIIDIKRKIRYLSNKYEFSNDDPYYGYRVYLKTKIKELQYDIDDICNKEINKVEQKEIEQLKKCYQYRSDLMEAAKKADVETFLQPELFNNINKVIHSIKKTKKRKRRQLEFINNISSMPENTISGINQQKFAEKLGLSIRAIKNKAERYFKVNRKKIILLSSNGRWGTYEKYKDLFVLEKRGRKKKTSG